MAYFTKGVFETIEYVLTGNAPVINMTGGYNPNATGDPNEVYVADKTTGLDPFVVQSTKKKTTTPTNKSYTWLWWFMLLLIPFSKKLFCKQQNKRRY